MEQKYLDALIEGERVSKEEKRTASPAMRRQGYIIVRELDPIEIIVVQGGGIDVFVSKKAPEGFYQEILRIIRKRRMGRFDIVSRDSTGKTIRYVPK